MHLGLIGGIGPAATEFYYRGLVRAFSKQDQPLELTIVNADTQIMLKNLANNAVDEQAEIFVEFSRRLQAAGADVVAVTSLGGHFCIEAFEALSPLPVINALPILDRYFCANGYRRVGLLGTNSVVKSGLYGKIESSEIVPLEKSVREQVHRDYISIATSGEASDLERARLLAVARSYYHDQGADAVALAGTDLFVAFNDLVCDFPVIDCASVHIEELVRIGLQNST